MAYAGILTEEGCQWPCDLQITVVDWARLAAFSMLFIGQFRLKCGQIATIFQWICDILGFLAHQPKYAGAPVMSAYHRWWTFAILWLIAALATSGCWKLNYF